MFENKEFMMYAVKQFGKALEDASEELQNDKEVVLEALKENGMALYYASEELQNGSSLIEEIDNRKKVKLLNRNLNEII